MISGRPVTMNPNFKCFKEHPNIVTGRDGPKSVDSKKKRWLSWLLGHVTGLQSSMLHPEKYVGSKISTQLSRGQQTSYSFGILPTFGAVDLQMLTGWGNDSLTKVDLKVGEAAFVTRKYHMKKPGPNWRIKATQWDQSGLQENVAQSTIFSARFCHNEG